MHVTRPAPTLSLQTIKQLQIFTLGINSVYSPCWYQAESEFSVISPHHHINFPAFRIFLTHWCRHQLVARVPGNSHPPMLRQEPSLNSLYKIDLKIGGGLTGEKERLGRNRREMGESNKRWLWLKYITYVWNCQWIYFQKALLSREHFKKPHNRPENWSVSWNLKWT